MRAEYICDLKQANLKNCGAKADNLAKLIEVNITVPFGMVILPSVFFIYFKLLEEQTQGNIGLLDMPIEFRDQLLSCLETLKAVIIVRSSARGEDSLEASFAGQLESIVCNNEAEEVWEAIKKCWASYFNDRVDLYQKKTGLTLDGMSVILQNYVDADFSGVLFSRSPISAKDIYVEYCEGACDKLVNGTISPNYLAINREKNTEIQFYGANYSQLPAEVIFKLVTATTVIKKLLSSEVDIEWCYTAQLGLQIVQARPITSIMDNPIERIADTELMIWSSGNIAENYPEPACPLLYSVAKLAYHHYFLNLGKTFGISSKKTSDCEKYLPHLVGSENGCLFYNLSSIFQCLGIAPAGGVIQSYWCTFLGLDADMFQGRKSQKITITDVFEFCRMLVFGLFALSRIKSGIQIFEQYAQNFYEMTKNLSSLKQLQAGLGMFRRIRVDYWRKAAVADAMAMFGIGILKSFMQRFTKNYMDYLPDLLEGIKDLESKKPLKSLWDLECEIRKSEKLMVLFAGDDLTSILQSLMSDSSYCNFYQKFEQYLDNWGFRFSGELLLTKESFIERPESLIHLLKMKLSSQIHDPELIEKQQLIRKENVINALRGQLRFWQFYLMKLALALTTVGIFYREKSRIKQAQIYFSLRVVAMRCGKYLRERNLLIDENDVFYFHFNELEELMNGSFQMLNTIPEIINTRKKHYHSMLPNFYPLNVKQTHSDWIDQRATPRVTQDTFDAQLLNGIGVSFGSVEASACVIHNLSEIDRLQPDSILVTRYTDPGWTLYFSNIKGLVLEHGGLLCHGAIVAREFGIPTVTNVKNATQIINSGDRLSLDGKVGSVKKI